MWNLRRVGAASVVAAACTLAPTASVHGQTGRGERPDDAPMRQARPFDLAGASIGVTIRDLNADESTTPAGGARIEDVRRGSAAERAGLQPGDVVLEFDGERVRSARHLARLVRESAVGRPLASTIVRGGGRQTVTITPEEVAFERSWPWLGAALEAALRRLPEELQQFEGVERRSRPARFGLSVVPLSAQLAEHFGAMEGVLVSSVEPGSPAASAGLTAGDVIVSVNRRPIARPADLAREARSATAGYVRLGVIRERKAIEVTLELISQSGGAADVTRPI